ncbi:MAG: transketolase [Chitinophagaceae bacterium]|nr:transketolase [Chitinophagaceae bacterium]MCZ2395257.1 transketolase [Chitinophagales bacterium]
MELIEQSGINTVRVLAADAVQKANSGHPGTPMALAPIGHVLWSKEMNYNPRNPEWPNRDRFILSCGHACMLQYAYLFLTGYDLTLNDIKNFRQLHSKTAGHPEYGLLGGIEVTTGPLGQGFANGVGMAIGQQLLAKRYNRPGYDLFNYKIYAIVSDGDLMEGVSSESASLAGTLKLGQIIYIYDDNKITIEGSTSLAFNENVDERFRGYGWHVQSVDDANDISALATAIDNARKETTKPSLIRVRSQIGYGSPNKAGSASTHGAPLGEDELRLVKKNFGFDPDQSFAVSDEVLNYYREKGKAGIKKEEDWNELYKKYKEEYPKEAAEYELLSAGKLPAGWEEKLPSFPADEKGMATRKASGMVLNAIADALPMLVGGSADLAPSNDTFLKKYDSFSSDNHAGRNFHFGIREHAMGSVLNGLALTKGIVPYGGTFLIFSDYMRPPLRLAAIMKIRPIIVYTHDSIGLGEDGTTHQPVEQLAGLRSVPNFTVIRPADANEVTEAWKAALLHKDGPVSLVLSRQNLPVFDRSEMAPASGLLKGAYILKDADGTPDIILMASGSEVQLALGAQKSLAEENIKARVVSFPSWELFEVQDHAYKESVLPGAVRKRLAIEAGSPMGWCKYTTDEGGVQGIERFGESAPAGQLMKEYGFTVAHVVARAKEILAK